MTNNIEEEKPNNKKLWIALTSVSAVALIGGLTFWGVSSNSSSSTPEGKSSSAEQSENASGTTPTITSVETAPDGTDIVFSISVQNVDTSKLSIEYQIADQNRVMKEEGKTRKAEFDVPVKLSDSAYYRIKVRAVDDSGVTTEWSDSQTVKLSEVEGFKAAEPAPAYFDTPWANGTDVSEPAVKKAIEVAWGAEELTTQTEFSSCIPINSGEMSPELLLPPIPSVMPNDVELMYIVQDWNGTSASINYAWC